jgi:hypothetical protein
MKNPMTPAGIEPAIFRFVAQYLNHCATAMPRIESRLTICAVNLILLLRSNHEESNVQDMGGMGTAYSIFT